MIKKQEPIMNDYVITMATKKDEDQIIKLLKEVTGWLKNKEIEQWGFLAEGGEDEEIKQAIINENTYVVKKDEVLVATFTLYEAQSEWDEHIWGQSNDGAVYLHRLAVTSSEIGSRLGKGVLRWLDGLIKDKGKNKLRLDCVENNTKLNKFYFDNGFEKVGSNDGHSKFQKRV
ncbi:GNAT family N-acetyltransferase [Bacillus sp. CGMCC 1.16607]|uniref:GNAT family N-acetyltransferase n=1 Tax=Bacillus sp. CGMCC 1.16607 TaxID=3351842 RepID=UPI00362B9FAF